MCYESLNVITIHNFFITQTKIYNLAHFLLFYVILAAS